MNNFSKKTKFGGFLTVEIIIAISIIVIFTITALSVAEKSIKVSRRTLQAAQAAFLVEEGKEVVRIRRDGSWNNISSLNTGTTYYPFFTGGVWTLTTEPKVVGIFTRTITVANVYRDNVTNDITTSGTLDLGTKLITVTVSWNDAGVLVTKNLQFYISDIFS